MESQKSKNIIRVQKNRENPYVMIDKTFLNDSRMTWKAKGLLTYFLSKPDDWRILVQDLIKKSKDGRDSVYAGLKELEQCGYLENRPVRDEKGKIVYWEKVIYEKPLTTQDPHTENPEVDHPHTENPDLDHPLPENPHLGNPHLDNPTLLNNEFTKERKILKNDNNNTASKTETAYKQDNDRESHSANVVVVDPILAFAKQHNLRLSEKVLVKWRKKTDDTMILLYLTHAVLDEKVKNKIAWVTTAIEEGFDLSVSSEVAATSQAKKKSRSAYIEKLRQAGAK